jgi:hypothetical protein
VMSRGPQSFKLADLEKALRAAKKAGLAVSRLEYDPRTKKIVIVFGKPDTAEANISDANEWDSVE